VSEVDRKVYAAKAQEIAAAYGSAPERALDALVFVIALAQVWFAPRTYWVVTKRHSRGVGRACWVAVAGIAEMLLRSTMERLVVLIDEKPSEVCSGGHCIPV
jgi:hypothetical protein